MRNLTCVVAVFVIVLGTASAQSPNATLTGQVLDSSGGTIAAANIDLVNVATNAKYSTKTNSTGMYLLPDLPPATYEIQVSHAGFKTIVKPDVLLNVRDAVVINFTLPLGAVSERVTVEGGAPLINTQDASVSTVVDRQFAENLPMNGRSFQTLIQLTPGIVLTVSNNSDNGQFSVNGQRASSNYWMVDGVSADIGIGVPVGGSPGNGLGGALGAFSVLGGTNSLVSVDALQEFRIQTSTYAPEFGRTPGAQISIVTRSGANQFHGSAFEYLRNDALDANNWFNGFVRPVLPKARERQNDFGGTFSGPIVKDRTFFFFSYEGLRLRLPQTTLTTVPDATARQNASTALQPFLNAYPLPNGSDNTTTGVAQFNASFSNPATLDAYSIRVDHRLTAKLSIFGRYNYSPSEIVQYGSASFTLNTASPTRITTQTATIGVTGNVYQSFLNDFRFNYSRTSAFSHYSLNDFGGAVPLTSPPFPSPFTSQDSFFQFGINSLTNGFLGSGTNGRNRQQQFNLIDNMSAQKGSHSLKFGVDFRRLAPSYGNRAYVQFPFFFTVSSAETGNTFLGIIQSGQSATFLFRDLALFAQDTWKVAPRLTLTYGLRWDIGLVPHSIEGPSFASVTGFDLNDLSNLALAPAGTPPYKTKYNNLAPRLGIAYELSRSQRWQTVLRTGAGVFYDLASSEAGNIISGAYPFGVSKVFLFHTFPFDSATAAPPAILPPNKSNGETLFAFDPNLQLPYTIEWNVALEQALGTQQTISAYYIASLGRRLLQTALVNSPNPNLSQAGLVANAATSDYNALQLQFQRRLFRGLQGLASYTWSHSIDTASAGSLAVGANQLVPSAIAANRGPSDFDIRHAFSAGVTYEVPTPTISTFTKAILGGWSLEDVIQVRSAPPVNVTDTNLSQVNGFQTAVRPDVITGQPLYVYGTNCALVFQTSGALLSGQGCPGGKGFNPNAFMPPPTDSNGNPLRQGNLGRNALRAFGAAQWDFAIHRDFLIREGLKLQFRAEMFNVLNHPNFGPPSGGFGQGGFGLSSLMLGQSLNGGQVGGGGFSALYQIGGPRSIQFALKLQL
jgi:hypothetical protein